MNYNVDKLKNQLNAKHSIINIAKSTPHNIQLQKIIELDLFSLKINLAERELLHKGLRYQDSGDFQQALKIFTTAGLRTSKPYVTKILIGSLHYEQGQCTLLYN